MPSLVQSAKTNATNGTGITLTLGATPTNGNTLCAIVCYSQFGSARTISTPAGWTKVADFTQGNDSMAIFTRTAGASEPSSVSFTISGSSEWASGSIYEVSGVGGTAIRTVLNSNTVSAAATTGYYVLAAFGIDGSSSSPSFTTGYTLRQATSASNFHNHATADKATAGPSESCTVTWPSGSTTVAAMVLFSSSAIPNNATVSQEAVEVLYSTSTGNARASQVAVEVLYKTEPHPPFISSVTAVYTPTLQAPFVVPFIASVTAVYAPTLGVSGVTVPFIASQTRVFGVFSLYVDTTGIGPGNGGEQFPIRLAPTGGGSTATLAGSISAAATDLTLTSDSGLPSDHSFVVTIDSEVLYLTPRGSGDYRIGRRALSNTDAASHTAGATVTWGDSYDQAIVAAADIAHEFTADIEDSGLTTYPGWLICFDATQAYLGASRYPMHVTEVVGVFDAGAGTGGTNRCDAAQPNAISSTPAASDDCPAALSNPSRISSNVAAGDVAVVRYTNPEASVLDLGPRSVALMSWFGLKRVDALGGDVTFTDPDGTVVDGSVNGEWVDPLGPGISPSTGEPTPNDVPYTSVTLLGTDRDHTRDVEKGWPICALAVRHGKRRIPFWASWDWHDFNYVYSGFGTDATFCQILINRNGIVFQSVPEVMLPGTQDIDGPDAVWDDGDYYFGASWYVAIFNTPYFIAGPSIGGFANLGAGILGPVPVVSFAPGSFTPTISIDRSSRFVEGGSGGGIAPPAGGLHAWTRF